MNLTWCKECRIHHFDGESCLPFYDVHAPEWHGDDMREHGRIRAVDEEMAACEWAERQDEQGDYTIVGGSPEKVAVRRSGSGASWRWFCVSGEAVPSYSADEIKAPEPRP